MALVAACLLAPGTAHAALGDPDPTYGNGGLATSDFGPAVVDGHVDGAGRALVATVGDGSSAPNAQSGTSYLSRFRADGSGVDTSWGKEGAYIVPFEAETVAFAPAPAGQWMVASLFGREELTVLRLSPDGVQNGQGRSSEVLLESVGDLEVLADGRVVVAGTDFEGRMVVARLTSDLDLEGPVGVAGPGVAQDVAVDAFGRAVVAGTNGGSGVVARVLPQGTIDTTFANGGTRQLGTAIRDVDVMPDGRILLAGSQRDAALLARLTADGALEQGFGTGGPGGGVVTFGPEGRPAGFDDATVDPIGGIYATGDREGARMLLARFDDRGFPDSTLQPAGFREIAGASRGVAVGLDAQERAHVLGAAGPRAAAARLLPNAPPTAAIAAPERVPLGSQAILDASGSTDPEKALRRFEWDLDGDASFETDGGTNPAIGHTFTVAGTRNVGVRVTDHRGLQSVAARQVQVEPPPPVSPVLGRAFVAEPASRSPRARSSTPAGAACASPPRATPPAPPTPRCSTSAASASARPTAPRRTRRSRCPARNPSRCPRAAPVAGRALSARGTLPAARRADDLDRAPG